MLRKKAWVWGVLLAVFLLADAALFLSVLTAPRPISSALLPTAEYLEQNPAPTPEFITRLSHGEDRLCAEVHPRFFAKVGVTGTELHQQLAKNLRFLVDSSQMPLVSQFAWATNTCENGKCYGGEINFCVDIGNLSPGLHLASITIPDLDGIEHTYSWAFRYDPNFPTAHPNILPTLAPLPTETPTP
jgi:hypothetical protein